jgi:hypothetical protein
MLQEDISSGGRKDVAETVQLEIAGICVEYLLGSGKLAREVRHEMGEFLSRKHPVLTLDLTPLQEHRATSWLPLTLTEEGNEFRVERHDISCRIDISGGTGSGVMAENMYAFGTFLRGLYSRLLLDRQGIILHASAVIRNGQAYAFTGPSGSGKTTIALISPENRLITDELLILRRGPDGEVLVCGTPFIGDSVQTGFNHQQPLRRLFFLVQARENRVEPIHLKSAMTTAMGQVMFFDRSPERITRLLEVVNELLAGLELSELHFLPDPTVWDLIDRLD